MRKIIYAPHSFLCGVYITFLIKTIVFLSFYNFNTIEHWNMFKRRFCEVSTLKYFSITRLILSMMNSYQVLKWAQFGSGTEKQLFYFYMIYR